MQVDVKAYWEQVKQFSQYPEDQRALGYVLGLMAEAGEVCGVVDKWLRGKYDEDDMERRLLDELGDVCWYAAACMSVQWWVGEGDDWIDDLVVFRRRPLGEVLSALVAAAADKALWDVLDEVATLAAWSGSSIQAVLDANVAKLRARHARDANHDNL